MRGRITGDSELGDVHFGTLPEDAQRTAVTLSHSDDTSDAAAQIVDEYELCTHYADQKSYRDISYRAAMLGARQRSRLAARLHRAELLQQFVPFDPIGVFTPLPQPTLAEAAARPTASR